MRRASGFIVSLIIAFISYGLSFVNPVFDPLVIAIIVGIIVSNFFESRDTVDSGADLAIKVFLPAGISLYGLQLKFRGELPVMVVAGLVVVFLMIYLLSFLISKRLFRIDTNTSTLIATGLAVCGASAIAVVSPAIDARKHETSISILSVTTAGLIYTMIYPLLKDLTDMSDSFFAFLAGSTLPMLGLVKVTASHVGGEMFSFALQLKYLRISSLIFMVALSVGFTGLRRGTWRVPWFMVLFVLFAVITNIVSLPDTLMRIMEMVSAFSLTVTLSAVGLRTSMESVSDIGLRPFVAAISSVTVVVLLICLYRLVS